MRIISYMLIALMALSAQALATARGEVMRGHEVVICAGETIMTITVDHDGTPIEEQHFCPDMVLSVLAAFTLTTDLPAPTPRLVARLRPVAGASVAAGMVPTARQRAPPLWLV